jgi:hypothetical protein
VTIGLFEATKTIGQTLTKNFIIVFDQYGFKKELLFISKMKGQI